MTDKGTTPPKPNLVNQWVLLWLLTGIWVSGYLQEQKWFKDNSITKAHPQHLGNLKHTAQPAGSSTGWRMSFPGASVDLKINQASCLVSASSRKLGWSQRLPCSSAWLRVSLAAGLCLLWCWGRQANLASFREFLKQFFVLSTSLLKEHPCKVEHFNLISEETVTQQRVCMCTCTWINVCMHEHVWSSKHHFYSWFFPFIFKKLLF